MLHHDPACARCHSAPPEPGRRYCLRCLKATAPDPCIVWARQHGRACGDTDTQAWIDDGLPIIAEPQPVSEAEFEGDFEEQFDRQPTRDEWDAWLGGWYEGHEQCALRNGLEDEKEVIW